MTRRALPVLLALVLVPAAGARQPLAKGTWTRLPPAPAAAALDPVASAWTGRQLIVFGRVGIAGAEGARNAAFSYTPATRTWRTLSPPKGDPGSYEGVTSAVWTGRLVLVVGPFTTLSYDPAANRWRQLPKGPSLGAPSGLLVWTGREMITWGGGCCGDVQAGGVAYDPATRRWRTLARAPVAGQQRPLGAWTGKELVVLPGRDVDGRPTRGAAYDPAEDTWRRIASPPQERAGANVVWDGREVLVVGGFGPPDAKGVRRLVAAPYAYDPAADRWRRISALDDGAFGRGDAAAVWTGKALVVWGGQWYGSGHYALTTHGLSYDPKANRWSQLPTAPLLSRLHPAAAWTGKQVLVWGGTPLIDGTIDGVGAPDSWPFTDGAAYTPAPR